MVPGTALPLFDVDDGAMREALAPFDRLTRPVWAVDATTATVWWANTAALELFGVPAVDVLISRDLCPLPSALAARLDRGLPPLPPGQTVLRDSVVVRQARNSVILDCAISSLRIEGGRSGLLVEGTPHAERPAAAPSARRAEDALSATAVMVSMFDKDGWLVYQNAAALAAYDPAACNGVMGSSLDGADGPRAAHTFRDRFVGAREGDHAWAAVCQGRVYRCEGRFKTAHGIRWHALEARPSLSATACDPAGDGDPHGAAGLVVVTEYDVTDYVLGRASLQDTVDRLARTNVELEQFAWISSHDLREPLRNVVSYLNLLKRRVGAALDPDAQEFMGYAIEGALRLDTLTRDLSEYASIGRSGRSMALVDMDAVVKAAKARLADEIAGSDAVVTAEGLPSVVGDEAELRMLVGHLLSNALKYMPDDETPQVTISAERENRTWVFAVIDNGIGIEPRYFERVFQIFQRLHGRDCYGGTGVGLAVCRKIVEHHGGRIWIESAPGKGAAFFFTLPAE